MGSGAETARETAAVLQAAGERVGVLQVRLYRPFAADAFLAALPASCRAIAVLEQTKEPGAPGEPLYLDVVDDARPGGRDAASAATMPRVVGGRYGLGSKNFNPAQVKAVFDELAKPRSPRHGFTVGIEDDVSHTSLALDPDVLDRARRRRARPVLRPGRGRHGRRQQEQREDHRRGSRRLYAQGYFVYDSHKSGAQTVSHLRFGPRADPRALPDRVAPTSSPATSSSFLEPHRRAAAGRAGRHVPAQRALRPGRGVGPAAALGAAADPRQEAALLRDRRVARSPARRGWATAINTVLQTCFFAHLRRAAARRGDRAHQALDRGELRRQGRRRRAQELPGRRRRAGAPARGACSGRGDQRRGPLAAGARRRAGVRARGDRADDGGPRRRPPGQADARRRHLPFGHRRLREAQRLRHRRGVAIRTCASNAASAASSVRTASSARKYYDERSSTRRPATFKSAPINARGYPDVRFTLQLYVEDCTGCGICVEVCPAHSPREPGMKAINLAAKAPILERERANIAFFEALADERSRAGRLRQRARRAVPAAAVRVLRAPAPAAARRPTSSCCRSSSATGCRSPMPPAARRSTAATCR